MEEIVGEFWHRLITRTVETGNADTAVQLPPLSSQLAPYFHAMGGAPGKTIEGSDPRKFRVQRNFLQKVAGSHLRFPVCWQDERSLRLPLSVSYFASSELNTNLYFWLAALAAKTGEVRSLFEENRRGTALLLANYPGLARRYKPLAEAILSTRPNPETLPAAERQREMAIRAILLHPEKPMTVPEAPGDPLPVPLWVYPAPELATSIAADEEIEESDNHTELQKGNIGRKEAKRTDDRKDTDGLLVFQAEALFSWTEQIELDRMQDENQEEDLLSTAEDLDMITLSRKRRAGSSSIKFDLDLPGAENDDLPLGDGFLLPEWNFRKAAMVENHCRLQPMIADEATPSPIPAHLKATALKLKNQFSLLQPDRRWQRHQLQGSEIDLDAWLEQLTAPVRNLDKQDYYLDRRPMDRDISCLLLADLSLSTESGMKDNQRVIDVIRDALILFSEALSDSGDRFAMYGFSSIKNKQVRYHLLKNFTERYSDIIRGRILAIKPGFYTRMGAAIRQSSWILGQQKSPRRMLLIISDGKPNDLDQYEGRYGIEDTRKAILEAKQQGIIPFCVTIDQDGNDYLPYLFGDLGYSIVSDAERLPVLLPRLYLHLTGIHT
jgi:nitric oxide reductase NorD protein